MGERKELMTPNYRKGADFERKVKSDMEAHGYVAVRSPASRSPCDVFCVKKGSVVFVQCKTNGVLPPGEWNEFIAYCELAGAIPVMALKGRRGQGIVYMRLLERKETRGKQPMVPWAPTE